MLRIPCPFCGVRDQDEFRYGGEASIVRPDQPENADGAEWADYLFYRNNLKGPRPERWLHSYGCGQWFLVVRDTSTNEIREARPITAASDQDHG
jgi:sarcosine oxidase subunit delta